MPFLVSYLLKLSISLSAVWFVYWFLLRRLTFYNWNRYFLLIYSMVAFVIPFIDISSLLQRHDMNNTAVMHSIPSLFMESGVAVSAAKGPDYWMVGIMVVAIGMTGMLVRLILQYASLYRIRKGATLLHAGGLKLYHVNEQIMPFSFGDSIFVNQHLHQEEELREIIRHEFIHVKQRHSVDILFGELLCMLNWYNPFAWLIRNAIRQNLEFIADSAVLSNGMDKKAYQYLLLKVTGVSQFSIASNFNFSSLKKRIAMMNKKQSAKLNLIRFLLVLPVISIVVLAFRGEGNANDKNGSVRYAYITDTVPPPPPPYPPDAPPPPDPPDAPALPDGIRSLHIENGKATVTLENGKVEQYDLNTVKGKSDFKARYGKSITLPQPPPPPKPPAPPKPVTTVRQSQGSTMIVDVADEPVVVQGYRAAAREAVTATSPSKIVSVEPVVVNGYRAAAREAVTAIAPSNTTSIEAVVVNGYRVASEAARNKTAPVTTATSEPVVVQGYRRAPAEVTVAGRPSAKRAKDAAAASELIADEIVVHPDGQVIGTDYDLQMIAKFNANSTQEDIDKIAADLVELGYKFHVEQSVFNNGKLVRLAASISKGNDKSSFDASDFAWLIISIHKKNGKSGIRVFVKNGKVTV